MSLPSGNQQKNAAVTTETATVASVSSSSSSSTVPSLKRKSSLDQPPDESDKRARSAADSDDVRGAHTPTAAAAAHSRDDMEEYKESRDELSVGSSARELKQVELYRDAVQCILPFLTLQQIATTAAQVNKLWLDAVVKLKSREEEVTLNLLGVTTLCTSSLRKHVTAIVIGSELGADGTDDNPSRDEDGVDAFHLLTINSRLPHLQSLTCCMFYTPLSHAHLVFPTHLRSLSLQIEFDEDATDDDNWSMLQSMLTDISRIDLLDTLHIGFITSADEYSPPDSLLDSLAQCTLMHTFSFRRGNYDIPKFTFRKSHIAVLRGLPSLTSIGMHMGSYPLFPWPADKTITPIHGCSITLEELQFLTSQPHHPQQQLQYLNTHELTFNAAAAECIARIPTLKYILTPRYITDTDFSFLTQLPLLEELYICCADEPIDIPLLVAAVSQLIHLRCFGIGNSPPLTQQHLTQLLSHLPKLEQLHLELLYSLTSLSFFSSPTTHHLSRTLQRLYLEFDLAPFELNHLFCLSALTTLIIGQSGLSTQLDSFTQSQFDPESEFFRRDKWPALHTFRVIRF